MSSQHPSLIVTLSLGLALASAVPCAVLAQPLDPPRPVEAGRLGPIDHPSIGDPQSPQPIELGRQLSEVARERAREAGVSFEIGPYGVEIRTEEEEMWILRAAPGSEIPALSRLAPGEREIFPLGYRIAVFKPLLQFTPPSDEVSLHDGECRTTNPYACPTPPPVPPAGFSEPLQPIRNCLECDGVCALSSHPCYETCCS